MFASVSSGPFHRGMASFSERKICALSLLRLLLSLWHPASECAQRTMLLLTTPAAAELSIWRGDFICGHFISCNVCLIATISCAVMNIATNYASEVEDMTNLMIFESVSRGPFHWGMASFSERKIWAPALLRPLLSLWNPASECAQRTMSLEL